MTEFANPTPPSTLFTDVLTGETLSVPIQTQVAASAAAASASASAAAASAATAAADVATIGTDVTDAAASAASAGTSASDASGFASDASGFASAASGFAASASASASAAAASAASLHGVPAGGTAGQALTKIDGTDYNMQWSTITAGVTSVFTRTGAVVAAANDYTFAQLASTPTTIAGYGITDYNSLGDARWLALAATAAKATILATARNINGVAFDGSAAITVTAAASTLSGTTLAALSGVNLTALNASNLGSGTVPTAQLGSGAANSASFLRGDQSWTPVVSAGWTTVHLAADAIHAQSNTTYSAAITIGSLTVGAKYRIRVFAMFRCSSGQGCKVNFNNEGFAFAAMGRVVSRTSGALVSDETLVDASGITAEELVNVAAITGGFVVFEGQYIPSTAGTIQLSFAQATSGATNTTLLAGSYIEYALIA